MKIICFLLLLLFTLSSKSKDKLLKKCSNASTYYLDQNEIKLQKTIRNKTIIVPIVIHLLWYTFEENIADEKIFEQLEELNNCFNARNNDLQLLPPEFLSKIGNANIIFCITPNGIIRKQTSNFEFGTKDSSIFFTNMGGDDVWNTDSFLNIYIVNTGSNIAGYGIYPWAKTPKVNGVVIHPKYIGQNNDFHFNLGKVLVHEMGHFLGLYHTWQDDNDCNTDDGIDDTPLQEYAYYNKPIYPQYSCGTSNMFMNFMDYVDDEAMYCFTKEQAEKMRKIIYNEYPLWMNYSNSNCSVFSSGVSSFVLSPNPVDDLLVINIPYIAFRKVECIVLNITGQIILTRNNMTLDKLIINVSSLSKGIYFIKIENSIQKFIKK